MNYFGLYTEKETRMVNDGENKTYLTRLTNDEHEKFRLNANCDMAQSFN